MAWLSSGRVVNPGLAAVLVDTGPLGQGARPVAADFACTVGGAVELQHRNAANDANIHSQIIALNGQGYVPMPPQLEFDVAEDERIRIVTVSAIVGIVSVSLWTTV